MDLGKIVWTVSFVLLLCSSPMLVFDLIAIQRSVEIASGADIWYDGQLAGDLLRLQVAIRGLPPDVTPESADPAQVDEINLRLDNVFNRINSLPETGSSEWHTRGIRSEEGVADVRRAVDLIDRALPLLASDPAAFRRVADDGVRQAIVVHRRMSLAVVERQNALIGRMQSQVSAFQVKLLGYGVGFVVLLLALGWLMRRHMRSETTLRATNRQLLDLTGNLVAARDAAVRSSEAKSNFLANVSHELRTPLNAILGFSEALASGIFGRLPGRQAEYVGDIHHAGQRLLALINDILDFSKAEAERIELHEEAVDLPRVVATCRHLVEPMARDGNIDVVAQFADRSVRLLWADELRLRQILLNLLTNAIKFTAPGGEVRVRVGRQADGGVEIRVEDNGIGMSPEGVAKALEPFGQIESALSRRHSGTGLGLPLAAHLVKAHGGRLVIESSLGWGTTVKVGLPPARLMDERLSA